MTDMTDRSYAPKALFALRRLALGLTVLLFALGLGGFLLHDALTLWPDSVSYIDYLLTYLKTGALQSTYPRGLGYPMFLWPSLGESFDALWSMAYQKALLGAALLAYCVVAYLYFRRRLRQWDLALIAALLPVSLFMLDGQTQQVLLAFMTEAAVMFTLLLSGIGLMLLSLSQGFWLRVPAILLLGFALELLALTRSNGLLCLAVLTLFVLVTLVFTRPAFLRASAVALVAAWGLFVGLGQLGQEGNTKAFFTQSIFCNFNDQIIAHWQREGFELDLPVDRATVERVATDLTDMYAHFGPEQNRHWPIAGMNGDICMYLNDTAGEDYRGILASSGTPPEDFYLAAFLGYATANPMDVLKRTGWQLWSSRKKLFEHYRLQSPAPNMALLQEMQGRYGGFVQMPSAAQAEALATHYQFPNFKQYLPGVLFRLVEYTSYALFFVALTFPMAMTAMARQRDWASFTATGFFLAFVIGMAGPVAVFHTFDVDRYMLPIEWGILLSSPFLVAAWASRRQAWSDPGRSEGSASR